MCGITGFYLKSGSAASNNENLQNIHFDNLEKATKAISHRGPDDMGLFQETEIPFAMGHTRLAILDLSDLGHQPMFSKNNDVVIVFNGEIYNFKELRKDLIENGESFKSNTDTEVILRLYTLYGKSMLTKLNGIFSIAIWDKKNDSLFIARDSFGIKPLYYIENSNGFFFSSEIKSLIKFLEDDDLKIDFESLDRYLSFLWCPGNGTAFNKIKKINPGEFFIVKQGSIEQRSFWYKLPSYKDKSKDKLPDLINDTRFFLRQAVHRQMISDAPVGAFLSGGLDSSSVVAFAKEVDPGISCFTINSQDGTEKGTIDDLPYARKTAKFLNVPLEVISINSKNMSDDLETMIYQLDEPLADPAALNVLYISEIAKKNNIKVLLSGTGGDDIFTGYRRHEAINSQKYFDKIPSKIRKIIEESSYKLNTNVPLFRKAAKLLSGFSLAGDERLVNYFKWSHRDDLFSLYSDNFKEQLNDSIPESVLLDFLEENASDLDDLSKMLLLEQRFFLTDHNLNYTDKMSMAAGVEVRVPFLDLDLVNFGSSIPNNYKQRGRTGKWILKKAMEPYLPKDIIYRPKTGFGAPVRKWIQFELNDLVNDTLSKERIKKRGLFDPDAIANIIKMNKEGKRDFSYTILSLLCIEIWCSKFKDS